MSIQKKHAPPITSTVDAWDYKKPGLKKIAWKKPISRWIRRFYKKLIRRNED